FLATLSIILSMIAACFQLPNLVDDLPNPGKEFYETRSRPPQTAVDKDKVAASSNSSVSGTPLARVDLNKVREAKIFAVLQAQHEGCLGSFKSFDSLFGNYLVPVTPSDEFFEQIAKK
uniref:Uncharacterized protein n=2 Tax=Aegilops tauschii TaxID=37682 RepID=A0A453FF84_AEGTS